MNARYIVLHILWVFETPFFFQINISLFTRLLRSVSVSVQSLSHVQLFVAPLAAACQASLSITSSQSLFKLCPLSCWCHPTISTSVVPFSSCPQSFPESGSSPMSHLFASGGRSIGVSASTSVLPTNTQNWLPLGSASLISLQFKGL